MNDVETRTPGALSSTKKDTSSYGQEALTPAVDVVEDSAGITLYADLPGVSNTLSDGSGLRPRWT
jgi:HSP20 family protein